MKTPSVKEYYLALQKQFELQSGILTEALPHSGERGRNDEERFREFLIRILPKKYSIGSGFMINSDASIPISSQTDVVIFDEFNNSPIHRELASHVFPIEMVYGAIEVKGRLEKRDLKKICRDISKIRKLAKNKYYINYGSVIKDPSIPFKRVTSKQESLGTLPPRTFVFAYEQKGWKTADELVDSLKEAMEEYPAHIHGMAILKSNWCISQIAYSDRNFEIKREDALLHFINRILHSIGSMRINTMSIDRYFGKN